MKISYIVFGTGVALFLVTSAAPSAGAEDFPKPYSAPCVERENVFAFTKKPTVKLVAKDRYEIAFAVKGNCDVTVGIVDEKGVVVRHVASGVLGANAPAPFQKNSFEQKLYWNGKDDLGIYPKEPEKLKVRVMLGLKPEFDKRLGPVSPYAMPGLAWGLGADSEGVYVGAVGSRGRLFMRRFDHDGKYVRTILPPPGDIPEDRLRGYSFVEYERGKRALHGAALNESLTSDGLFHYAYAGLTTSCRPAISRGRLYYTNNGRAEGRLRLYWLKTDGSGDSIGQSTKDKGTDTGVGSSSWDTQLAGSPDGRWIYMVIPQRGDRPIPCVFRGPADGSAMMKVVVGDPRRKPGSGPGDLGSAQGIDVDAKGRVYVADSQNNAVKIFSADGKFLKAIPVDRPRRVAVHQATGAIYVSHQTRVRGKSVGRITKFSSFDNPKAEKRLDGLDPMIMIVDSWASRPRVWMACPVGRDSNNSLAALALCGRGKWGPHFAVWEETDDGFRKALDFVEEVSRSYVTKVPFIDIWRGNASHDSKVICDPTREEAYYGMSPKFRFDLETGRLIDRTVMTGFDHGFDKHGYVHCHFGPGGIQGVGRLDPSQEEPSREGAHVRKLREVPYDYGVPPVSVRGGTPRGWIGVIHTKDQSGAQAFLDGMGVNMRGDVAENCNVFYVPKMEDIGKEASAGGIRRAVSMGGDNLTLNRYASFMQGLAELEKKGEAIYFIKRGPGRPLTAATIWTFDRTGELRSEAAAVVGDRLDGVQIDENGCLYFVTARLRMTGSRHFLRGRGGVYGNPGAKPEPLTGTLVKGRPDKVEFRVAGAPVPMEPLPDHPHDLIDTDWPTGFDGRRARCWVEGAEWLYAGASPIVFTGCECPTMRFSTDWYRRTFVPEAYRHSIGVLDTAGNLVMHVGRYGNLDSADGPKSMIPAGGDGVAIAHNNKVSATDDYLVFDDCGERLTVLKLNYHAEETVPIGN